MNLTYVGSASGVSQLAHMLRQEGVQVDYQPPIERKDMASVMEAISVDLLTAGPVAVIAAVVARFTANFGGRVEGLPKPSNIEDRLQKLQTLRDEGVITADEYTERRKTIIGEI